MARCSTTRRASRLRRPRIAHAAALSLFALIAATAAQAQAQAQALSTSAAESDLLRAEDALFAADVTHDVAAIDRGFAKEAVFVHANGSRQTKEQYIEAARNPKFQVKDVVGRDRVVRIFGNVGIVRGTKTLTVGDEMHLSGTYLSVYVRRDGRWQLLDEQSSPDPQTSRR